MTLFIHHSPLRLLAHSELCATMGGLLLANRSLDYIITRVYSSPDVTPNAHAAVASITTELVNCAGKVDDDTFGRLEQLAMLIAEPPHGQGVLECYAHLLARAVQHHAGDMPASNAKVTLCDMGVRAFAPASPAQAHLCEQCTSLRWCIAAR